MVRVSTQLGVALSFAQIVLPCTARFPIARCPHDATRNATFRVHRYTGDGSWQVQHVHEVMRLNGGDLLCDDADDVGGKWTSQNGQDRRVQRITGNAGFFVDMAANRPITHSNTRALERDFGWHGLCLDGNTAALPELARRRTCQVGGAIVSSRSAGAKVLPMAKAGPALKWITCAQVRLMSK